MHFSYIRYFYIVTEERCLCFLLERVDTYMNIYVVKNKEVQYFSEIICHLFGTLAERTTMFKYKNNLFNIFYIYWLCFSEVLLQYLRLVVIAVFFSC